jgi:hypothetical protein
MLLLEMYLTLRGLKFVWIINKNPSLTSQKTLDLNDNDLDNSVEENIAVHGENKTYS